MKETLALAADYDGTLAQHGRVDVSTRRALARWKAAGKKLILITGREMEQLRRVFWPLKMFDLIVAENGGLLYFPAEDKEQLLADLPPSRLLAVLDVQLPGVVSVGRVIVATRRPHDQVVRSVLADLELPLQIIYNKNAVMVLPTGVNKATGLAAAVEVLDLDAQQTAGVGDAENDIGFLQDCGLSAAVANALPEVKRCTTYTAKASHGAGVAEWIEQLLRP